ncbi:hypothetical protein GWI33_007120 [Rhynchophorus ferrugineus]|uniref:Uncharacterized protein n=1 Tax=Rhynchophorus ferrugineus TaxID=354439 RepID=A0A834IW29_RHYFE|nr:hypothetical protein GWI33_007120 [Rhynchophorus ferrugineus]
MKQLGYYEMYVRTGRRLSWASGCTAENSARKRDGEKASKREGKKTDPKTPRARVLAYGSDNLRISEADTET